MDDLRTFSPANGGSPRCFVILGHVDSAKGAAVFYELGRLRPGHRIEVTRADGRTVQFTVESVERVPKERFPTGRVYGPLDHAGLRLVTCGGSFDRNKRSYRDNIIVYAAQTAVLAPDGPRENTGVRPSTA